MVFNAERTQETRAGTAYNTPPELASRQTKRSLPDNALLMASSRLIALPSYH